jgi:hypothetical protein
MLHSIAGPWDAEQGAAVIYHLHHVEVSFQRQSDGHCVSFGHFCLAGSADVWNNTTCGSLQTGCHGLSVRYTFSLAWYSAQLCVSSVPAWSFQLHDSTGTLHWIGPEWPKNGLGDPHAGFRPYAEAGSTALATIPLDSLQTCYWFSDAEACHQIMDREDRFKKDMASVGCSLEAGFLVLIGGLKVRGAFVSWAEYYC